MQYETADEVLTSYPMVESVLMDLGYEDGLDTDQAISKVRREFESKGPYQFCKNWGCLVNNSAEEFSSQWMSFFNTYTGHSHY